MTIWQYVHRVPKKTCDYIFHNNFNNTCPITIIFGIVLSIQVSVRQAHNKCSKCGSINALLKKIRRAGRLLLIGNQAVSDRVLCVSTRTLRMSKTLCSVRKTIHKRTDWIVKSHMKLAFTDWLYTNNFSRSPAQLCQTMSRTADVWNQSLRPTDSLQAAVVRGTVWLHMV